MSQENFDASIDDMIVNYKNIIKNNKKKYIVSKETFLTLLPYSRINYSEQPPMTLEEANQFREKLREERKSRISRVQNFNCRNKSKL